jgi:hypothetical protein
LRRFVAVILHQNFKVLSTERELRDCSYNLRLWYFLEIISAKLCFQMAVAASNKNSSKPGFNYPELEGQALQFILDCCESNIAKYTKYVEVMSF